MSDVFALLVLLPVRAFVPTFVGTHMPSADSCVEIKKPYDLFSLEYGTRRRSPGVSSSAFTAHPPDSQPWLLMDVDFVVSCPLVQPRLPQHPVPVRQVAVLLTASFRRHLAMSPLRLLPFASIRLVRDFHPPADEHARHTTKKAALKCAAN